MLLAKGLRSEYEQSLLEHAVLLFLACGAHADTFVDATLSFTVSHGGPAPTGSFIFDYTTNQFTSFMVSWDGSVYDFASEDNADSYYSYLPISDKAWCAIGKSLDSYCGGNDSLFLSFGPAYQMGASVPFATDMAGSDEADGTYSVTCQGANGPIPCPAERPAVPEPSGLPLALLATGSVGVLALGLRRKPSDSAK